jgi:hypothetical protein
MRSIAQVFQFSIAEKWSYFKYLGIPISLKYPYSQVWKQILEKISNTLSHWGTQWLNPTTRVVLIKIVLSTLPIYQSSALLAPKNSTIKWPQEFDPSSGKEEKQRRKSFV